MIILLELENTIFQGQKECEGVMNEGDLYAQVDKLIITDYDIRDW